MNNEAEVITNMPSAADPASVRKPEYLPGILKHQEIYDTS
jgi:hypothetical protein